MTLNIWTPAVASSRRPVMVWLHSGDFRANSANSPNTDGQRFADEQNVVIVAANYRLGPFGFLTHTALTLEDRAYPSSGNYGLADQRAALRWVRDHIAAFGGDPENVTLFGQSAGAVSTSLHLVSPASRGLFHRAVLHSGQATARITTMAEAEAQGDAFARALGARIERPCSRACEWPVAIKCSAHSRRRSSSFRNNRVRFGGCRWSTASRSRTSLGNCTAADCSAASPSSLVRWAMRDGTTSIGAFRAGSTRCNTRERCERNSGWTRTPFCGSTRQRHLPTPRRRWPASPPTPKSSARRGGLPACCTTTGHRCISTRSTTSSAPSRQDERFTGSIRTSSSAITSRRRRITC